MKVIVRPRQGGKTTELLQLAVEHFAYIVCPDMRSARHVWDVARHLGLNIPQPITWQEFLEHRYRGAGVKAFIIDDLDACLESMTMVPIIAASMTGGLDD